MSDFPRIILGVSSTQIYKNTNNNNLILTNNNLDVLTLDNDGNGTFINNLTIESDLIVNGNTITINTETLLVEDPLISLSINNTGDNVDSGFYSKYNDGVDKYTGLFRDVSDGQYKLFKELEIEPTSTINTSGTGYELADLNVQDIFISGNLKTDGNIAIGESDSGFNWVSDGIFNNVCNNIPIIQYSNTYIDHYSEISDQYSTPFRFRKNATSTTDNYFIQFFRSSTSISNGLEEGDLRLNASGNLSLTNTSDLRLKENITEYTNGYNKVKNLRIVEFDWKDILKKKQIGRTVGVIAQEMQQVLPKSVGTLKPSIHNLDQTEYLNVSYSEMIPFNWSATRTLIQNSEKNTLLINNIIIDIETLSEKFNNYNHLEVLNYNTTFDNNKLDNFNQNILNIKKDLIIMIMDNKNKLQNVINYKVHMDKNSHDIKKNFDMNKNKLQNVINYKVHMDKNSHNIKKNFDNINHHNDQIVSINDNINHHINHHNDQIVSINDNINHHNDQIVSINDNINHHNDQIVSINDNINHHNQTFQQKINLHNMFINNIKKNKIKKLVINESTFNRISGIANPLESINDMHFIQYMDNNNNIQQYQEEYTSLYYGIGFESLEKYFSIYNISQNEFLPTIFRKGKLINDELELYKHGLNVNDVILIKYKINSIKYQKKITVVKILDATHIKINNNPILEHLNDINHTNIFIYGEKNQDCISLNQKLLYSISSLALSGVKAIDHKFDDKNIQLTDHINNNIKNIERNKLNITSINENVLKIGNNFNTLVSEHTNVKNVVTKNSEIINKNSEIINKLVLENNNLNEKNNSLIIQNNNVIKDNEILRKNIILLNDNFNKQNNINAQKFNILNEQMKKQQIIINQLISSMKK
jgi:hypothetical protein